MKTASDADNWRKKYFDSLSSLESEQRNYRAMESTLKRLAGRLCIAALGQSPALDALIKKLQTVMRREVSSDELEELTPALTEAIHALDHSSSAPATAPAPSQSAKAQSPAPGVVVPIADAVERVPADDGRVRAILAALMVELRRDPELVRQTEAVDAKLAKTIATDQLPDVLTSVTALVGHRIERIERAKAEVEVLLGHMVGRLDEIGQFVADQNQNQSQSQASSETLNVQLVGEMRAMGESVEAASDLQLIRSQVRHRLDSIDRHLQEFRQREATRASAIQARNEQMGTRVAELEAEASRLHSQLRDEQRLSTIDTLTKIPNRLAYEKRIEEELQRWQRFKQPACLAVWDVDRFKSINDGYGHRAGDKVLATVAECLAGRIRSTDFVARYGGEEFVMILAGTALEDALKLVDTMRMAVADIGFHFRGTPLKVTISVGITALLTGDSGGAAFDRADKALYRAKDTGRNRCVSG